MKNKVTRRMALIAALEENVTLLSTNEYKEVIKKMIASIDKQASKPKEKSLVRKQNEEKAQELLPLIIQHDAPIDTKWVMEHTKGVMNSQKATKIMEILLEQNEIRSIRIKNKSYWVHMDWKPSYD